jgi:hypothetical protein
VNTIAVVLMPHGIGSQVLINGVEISHACKAIEIIAEAGEPTTVVVTLVGRVELMADVGSFIVEHDG